MSLLKPERRGPRPRKPIQRSRAPIARKARPRKERKSSVGSLKRKLWRLFAGYVKARDGNTCVTCGKPMLVGQDFQAGHWIRQDGHAAVEFDPKNVHPQCGRCNGYERGNVAAYSVYMLDRYGEAEVRRMVTRSRMTHCWKEWELRDLIAAMEKGPAEYECLYYERYL